MLTVLHDVINSPRGASHAALVSMNMKGACCCTVYPYLLIVFCACTNSDFKALKYSEQPFYRIVELDTFSST